MHGTRRMARWALAGAMAVLAAWPGPVRAAEEPPWGEAVDGVQVRLVPTKAQWKSDETPTFTAEIRNTGEHERSVLSHERGCSLEFDGCRYGHGDASGILSPLAPGGGCSGIRITLDGWWQGWDLDERLELAPGKHAVRVAFNAAPNFLLGGDVKSVRAFSNTVQIEVLAARRSEADLVAALLAEDKAVRCDALRLLAGFRTKTALDAVAFYVADPDEDLRTAAADALGSPLGRSDVARTYDLLTALLACEAQGVRQHAAFALGRLGDRRAVELLKECMPEAPMVYAESLWRLGEPFDCAWLTPVIRAGETGRNDWQNAVWMIQRYGGKERAAALIGCLDANNPSAQSYYNYTLVWQIRSCGGPDVRYEHDFDSPGTREQIRKNAETLKTLLAWAAEGKPPEKLEPRWGPPYDSVQFRLVPDKPRWNADETPTFKVSLRNDTKRKLRLVLSPENVRIRVQRYPALPGLIDEHSYPGAWLAGAAGEVKTLEPGAEVMDLPLALDGRCGWRREQTGNPVGLWLEKMTISVRVLLQPADEDAGKPVIARSGGQSIEIVPAAGKQ